MNRNSGGYLQQLIPSSSYVQTLTTPSSYAQTVSGSAYAQSVTGSSYAQTVASSSSYAQTVTATPSFGQTLTAGSSYAHTMATASAGFFSSFWSVSVPSLQVSVVSTSLRIESVGRIQELGLLKDDWDGYGGFGPSHSVCGNATQLINSLATDFPNLASPTISPSSNGTVLLTWEASIGEAVLEIGDTKFSGYIRRSNSVIPVVGEAQHLGRNELSAIAGCLA